MTIEKKIAKLFGLHGDEWLKHANPWSIWSRFATLPFLILAIWSREWIAWYSLIPIIILLIWIVINPKLFKPPTSTDNWASKCVLGEKIWANRDEIDVPVHHKPIINILTLMQTIGGISLFTGLYQFDFCLTFSGMIIVYFAKMWFLDRMVWIFEDMKLNAEYQHLSY